MSQDNGNSNGNGSGNGKGSDKGNGAHNKDWSKSPFSESDGGIEDRLAPLPAARAEYQGIQFTQQADGTWRDPWGKELRHRADGELEVVGPEDFLGHEVQPQGEIEPHQWFWDEWIPAGQCTALSGVTGVRKSTFLLQLLAAAALGQPYFLGRSIQPSPCVMGLFCEDSHKVLKWRLSKILKRYGATMADFDEKRLVLRSLVGVRETELVEFGPSGQMRPMAMLKWLEAQLIKHRPKVLVLDIMADFFGGNEINRRHASQFIRLLDALCQKYGCTIIYSHHPSLEGERSGSGRSGSTGWEGKIRSYLTMTYEESKDNPEEDDKDSPNRILTRVSSNYAKPGVKLDLVIKDDSFILRDQDKTQPPKETGIVRDLKVRSRFMELLEDSPNTRGYVSRSASANGHFAPKEFHKIDPSISEDEYKAAMEHFFREKRIRIDNQYKVGKRRPPGVIVKRDPLSEVGQG